MKKLSEKYDLLVLQGLKVQACHLSWFLRQNSILAVTVRIL